MATPTRTAPGNNRSANRTSWLPPEERFWKRYSPHHELPLSTASSVLLHGLILALLVLGGIILARFGFREQQVQVGAVTVVSTGGGPNGTGEPGKSDERQEAVRPSGGAAFTEPRAETTPNLKPPRVEAPPLLPEKAAERSIQNVREIDKQFAAAVAEVYRRKLDQALHGATAGETPAAGPAGDKDRKGPGAQKADERKKRLQRWVMVFNTQDGADYARQLTALKAMLAVPTGEADQVDYLFIEDLGKRPVETKRKDLSKIDRIYWIDDKPESVKSLASALKLDPVPKYVVAFFPEKFEKELLKKELTYRKTPEDQIQETHFKVEKTRSGGYEAVVTQQTKK